MSQHGIERLRDELDDVKEHINHDHSDTVGLIAHFLVADRVARTGTVAASIARVDPQGVDVTISALGAVTSIRHDFADRCDSIDDIRVEFFSLLGAARSWMGNASPLTSLERELAGDGYTTFLTEVAAVVDLAPTLRQITFRGGLDDFVSLGGDQFLYVLLPPRGRHELTVGADFTWQQHEAMPELERPAGAYYTVREWRLVERELDMWFVLHGDAGDASAWASLAEPGQPVALWGPRRSFEPPAATSSYLLVVDETGLGAAAAVLDELLEADPEVDVALFAEVGNEAGRVEYSTGVNVTVKWLDRQGREPGSTSLLIDAVADFDIADDVYAFGAAESRRITAVRTHLRTVGGLNAEQVSMTGYWRAT